MIIKIPKKCTLENPNIQKSWKDVRWHSYGPRGLKVKFIITW